MTDEELTLPMKAFLQELIALGSVKAALASVDGAERSLRRWTKIPTFRALFDQTILDNTAATRGSLHSSVTGAVDVYEEALQATKTIERKFACEACGERNEVEVIVENWAARLKAAETLLKITGILKEQKTIDFNAKIETRQIIVLTTPEHLAWERYKTGLPIPPHMEALLTDKGLIGQEALPAPKEEVIEADFVTVE